MGAPTAFYGSVLPLAATSSSLTSWASPNMTMRDDYKQEVKTWKQLHAAKQVEDLHPDVLAMAEGYGMLEENAREPKSMYGHRPVVHIVCDDLMGSPLMSGGPRSKLVNTCIRHRHIGNSLGFTLWLCVQSWSAQGSV